MATINTINNSMLLTNVEKITFPNPIADYNPGKPFKILTVPKSSKGISKGTLLSIVGKIYKRNGEREVTLIAGDWSPAIFSSLKCSAYTYGNATAVGVIYKNDGNYYLSDETVKAYDNSATYAVGEYAINSSKVYKCATAVETAENFDSDKWSEVSNIAGMVSEGILIDLSETDIYVAGIMGL